MDSTLPLPTTVADSSTLSQPASPSSNQPLTGDISIATTTSSQPQESPLYSAENLVQGLFNTNLILKQQQELKETNNSQQETIDKLTTIINTLQQTIASLQETIDRQNGTINGLTTDKQQLQTRCDELTEQCTTQLTKEQRKAAKELQSNIVEVLSDNLSLETLDQYIANGITLLHPERSPLSTLLKQPLGTNRERQYLIDTLLRNGDARYIELDDTAKRNLIQYMTHIPDESLRKDQQSLNRLTDAEEDKLRNSPYFQAIAKELGANNPLLTSRADQRKRNSSGNGSGNNGNGGSNGSRANSSNGSRANSRTNSSNGSRANSRTKNSA